jgi:hypothetical protein
MTVRELDALHQEYLSSKGHLLPIEEYGLIYVYAIMSILYTVIDNNRTASLAGFSTLRM